MHTGFLGWGGGGAHLLISFSLAEASRWHRLTRPGYSEHRRKVGGSAAEPSLCQAWKLYLSVFPVSGFSGLPLGCWRALHAPKVQGYGNEYRAGLAHEARLSPTQIDIWVGVGGREGVCICALGSADKRWHAWKGKGS